MREAAMVESAVMAGTGFELLVQAGAVADPVWRGVPTGCAAFRRRLLEGPDAPSEAEVSRVGRLGWLNLMPLLASSPDGYGVAQLLEVVRALAPARLHRVLLGGERRQLRAVVDDALLDAAVAGERAACSRLREVLRREDLVVGATEHLLRTSSPRLYAQVVGVLARWRARLDPGGGDDGARDLEAEARVFEAELTREGPVRYLERTVPGMTYRLAASDRVAVVVSPSTAPVVVDALEQVLVVHPPLLARSAYGDPSGDLPTARLVELGRAVGDATRERIVAALADRDHSAVRLAERLGAPRTTLLHHLALLRSAGLLHVEVSPGSATVYRLRPEGLLELSRLAQTYAQPTR